MPYRQVYEPAPKDMSLKVWQEAELPAGVRMKDDRLFRRFREADLITDDKWLQWYECHHCGGFIEGRPNEYKVNTMNSHRLSGRNGTEFYCVRCGEQIAFSGMVS